MSLLKLSASGRVSLTYKTRNKCHSYILRHHLFFFFLLQCAVCFVVILTQLITYCYWHCYLTSLIYKPTHHLFTNPLITYLMKVTTYHLVWLFPISLVYCYQQHYHLCILMTVYHLRQTANSYQSITYSNTANYHLAVTYAACHFHLNFYLYSNCITYLKKKYCSC